jgi:hypothetical protein
VAVVLGPQKGCEAANRVVAHASLCRRGHLLRPGAHTLHLDEAIAGRGGEPGVADEKPFLLLEAKTKAALQGDVALDMGHQL